MLVLMNVGLELFWTLNKVAGCEPQIKQMVREIWEDIRGDRLLERTHFEVQGRKELEAHQVGIGAH